jgi:hypothetical protein
MAVGRKRAFAGLLAGVPLVAAACGGGGSATPPATTSAAPGRTKETAVTIRVRSVVSGRTEHDTPPRGASAGDRIVFTDRLLNAARQFGRARNTRVGSDRWTMTFTSAHSASLAGEADLPDGKIRFAGPLTPDPNQQVTVPIVGGTGRYAHASGVLVVGSGASSSVNVFRLVLGGIPGPAA